MRSQKIRRSLKPSWGASGKCLRCGGTMIHERFYGQSEHFLGWRCVACGEIIDETVLENRQKHRAAV